ncbi:hypothetical protein GGX14DRAFT_383377 [Mycena pura]|uniref:DUF6589 domain-containing protein n=1 Tax=Mycena pura TaxID=153505 RepID=A0AAD6UK48_9AGAR|nr:hypothetical protein GGX14DRAFT_383377 [Mycena pura]
MTLEIASRTQLQALLTAADQQRLSLPTFFVSILRHSDFTAHPEVLLLLDHSNDILRAFLNHPRSSPSTLSWAEGIIKTKYARVILDLAKKENGWHFSASNTQAKQLENFRIEEMAAQMKSLAPELWDLLGLLLSANRSLDTDISMEEDSTEDSDLDSAEPKSAVQKLAERREALAVVKKVVMISLMMQSTNKNCNALGSVFGIFLHASNTPSKVIEALAHMGISISVDAIDDAVHALSRETYHTLRAMGQTFLVGYAYDNFDINFSGLVPTIETDTDTLTHMTSGCLIFLEHGVKPDDLRCSKELWDKNPVNPAFNIKTAPAQHTILDLEGLHPETDHPSNLTRRERFNSYFFRQDLVKFGPTYFSEFSSVLGKPEMVEQVPDVPMRWAPAKSLDVKQSTVAGNLKVIPDFLEQGGVGDPSEKNEGPWERNVQSIIDYVVLFHGDLGTGERITSLLQRRSIESTPWRRYQYVVYIMGLFHMKMAAADAIWRIFLEPKSGRDDTTSLMHFVALFRPKETGKIGSDPGFRRMHEVIAHVGAALRLDAWRLEVLRRNPQWTSLQAFADSKPSFDIITEMSDYLASHAVAGAEDLDIFELRQKLAKDRDMQHENILQMHQYFLLYEELSFSMNFGDIGRIETLFPTWIYIFKAVGKHKYATHMLKFMTDLHFVYPAPLRHAIRYNMLPNPTGKEGKCRGVDWVVEQMINLPTKVILY